jgi:hypothetical protein
MSFFSNLWNDVESFGKWIESFGGEAKTISADVVTDIQLISSGLSGSLAAFEGVTGIAPTVVAEIEAKIAAISTAAEGVVSTVASNVAEPIVTQISTDFGALKTALTGVSLPAALESVLNAVSALLPYILAAVGVVSVSAGNASVATGLTPDQARLILKAE